MHWDAEAIRDFEAEEDDEIGFVTGMKFHLIECTEGKAWWKAVIGKKTGLIPSNFVKKTPSKVNDYIADLETSEIVNDNVDKLFVVYDDFKLKCESIYSDNRDYNRAVRITLKNFDPTLSISIDVLKVLIMLKFNNLFIDICNFDDISVLNVTRFDNYDTYSSIRSAEFIVTFEQPLSTYYFEKFNESKLTALNAKLISNEHLDIIKFQLFR